MNLFNKIEKVTYKSNNPNEFVSLVEYVLFEDERQNEKYLVFKFVNNLNQSLYKAKFEVCQYNKNKDLVEKCSITFDNFKAKTKETFVPKGKLKVNKDFDSLSIELVSAKFEKMVFENGECADIPYTFDEYKDELSKKEIKKQTKVLKRIKEKFKRRLSDKSIFKLKDITKKYSVKFPKVLNTIVMIAMLILTGVGAVSTTQNSQNFTYDYTDYYLTGDNTVRIVGYENNYGVVTVGGNVFGFEVTSVGGQDGKAAFNNANLQVLTFSNNFVTIYANSFENCKYLNTISTDKTVSIQSYAFANCPNLTTIDLTNGTVANGAFVGCHQNIQNIRISRTYGANRLGDLFGCNNEDLVNLQYVEITGTNVPYGFYDGLPKGCYIAA